MTEYLRRNLMVAKACGVASGINHAIARIKATKRPPKWLLVRLDEWLVKQNEIVKELAAHKGEVKHD